jgi:hypothetical protein
LAASSHVRGFEIGKLDSSFLQDHSIITQREVFELELVPGSEKAQEGEYRERAVAAVLAARPGPRFKPHPYF